MSFWHEQLKKGFELALKEVENMETKEEIMSNEVIEINNIIALAKADDDVKQVLLSEITKEFTVFYSDMVYEVIELAKHDCDKMITLITAILKDELIGTELQRHFDELRA